MTMLSDPTGIDGASDGWNGDWSDGWSDGWYWSTDGLRLHWREQGRRDAPVLLCIPGLTRTARDFGGLGARVAATGRWRVIAVDLRGRGESAWPRDPLSYLPLVYLRDLSGLIAAAGVTRFVALGSSMGGVLAMQLTLGHRPAMLGAILNDIGPDIEAGGLARLRANVGRQGNWPTWVHAARDLAQKNGGLYPDWGLADWLVFAKRLCRLTASGRVVFDYDPRIAEPFRLPHGDAWADLWVALAGLDGLPVLSLRAARSDVLSAATQGRMAARLTDMTMVEVAGVGHAPTLDEKPAVAAVMRFLAGIGGSRMVPG